MAWGAEYNQKDRVNARSRLTLSSSILSTAAGDRTPIKEVNISQGPQLVRTFDEEADYLAAAGGMGHAAHAESVRHAAHMALSKGDRIATTLHIRFVFTTFTAI